jgi:hypothetical protein
VKITQEQAQRAEQATDAAVTEFSRVLDVDQTAGRNALFGALLAEFWAANGAGTRAALDDLLTYIEDRTTQAAELDRGAAEVEVP